MNQAPTRAQLRILRVIRDFQAAHHYPPTVRQIVAAAGLTSPGSMAWHLRRLQEQGLLAARTSHRECWRITAGLAQAEPDRPEDDRPGP